MRDEAAHVRRSLKARLKRIEHLRDVVACEGAAPLSPRDAVTTLLGAGLVGACVALMAALGLGRQSLPASELTQLVLEGLPIAAALIGCAAYRRWGGWPTTWLQLAQLRLRRYTPLDPEAYGVLQAAAGLSRLEPAAYYQWLAAERSAILKALDQTRLQREEQQ